MKIVLLVEEVSLVGGSERMCTGEWIDVTMPESLHGVTEAGTWADLYCTRGQHEFASGRTLGEER